MPVPAKELEYYNKTVKSKEAIDLLITVMQSLFQAVGKASVTSIRQYLTLMQTTDVRKHITVDTIEHFMKEFYKREFINYVPKEHPFAEELLQLSYMTPSDYTLRNMAIKQYEWILFNYNHTPARVINDDAAIDLYLERFFASQSVRCPNFEDKVRTYLFSKHIEEDYGQTA